MGKKKIRSGVLCGDERWFWKRWATRVRPGVVFVSVLTQARRVEARILSCLVACSRALIPNTDAVHYSAKVSALGRHSHNDAFAFVLTWP